MALTKKPTGSTYDATGSQHAQETFEQMRAEIMSRADKLRSLPKVTEALAFRLPLGEKGRIRQIFARNGMTLTQGIKAAVYEYVKKLEKGE